MASGRSALDRAATALPARGIVAVSEAAGRAQRALRPHRPVAVVHPGVDLERFDSGRLPRPADARARLGLPAEGGLVGIVARLQRWKGVHVLIEALPQVIDKLRANGFRFLTIHELLGISRDAVMPKVPPQEQLTAAVNNTGFILYSAASWGMVLVFELGIALGTLRLLLVSIAATVHVRRERRRWGNSWKPKSFAALIPAFNEEKVICRSIRALLDSRLRKFEIIVVDDGSTDRTVDVVRKQFAFSRRVRVLTKPNGGKWSALNFGLRRTCADVVVSIDADTLFDKEALQCLLRHFEDDGVGAVAGAACVGNRINLITGFQALEYVTSQNLDRRALELVNGITVVPGAIGAWRRDALRSVGGYSPDTLAEDADATVRLVRAGWKVLYEPRALARTEAPETIRGFMKQRFRWMFGTLQVAYKHIDAFRSVRAIGPVFGLTNVVLFQFLFTLISPVIDLMLVGSIASALSPFNAAPTAQPHSTLATVRAYWAFFQVLDLLTAALAISFDRQRGLWHLLPLLLIQRFCYRQLLYVTALRTALTALKGQMVGWNKLLRTGKVALASTRGATPRPIWHHQQRPHTGCLL